MSDSGHTKQINKKSTSTTTTANVKDEKGRMEMLEFGDAKKS